MTVTIEVKPETAQLWQQIARREGRAVEAVATEAAETGTDALVNARERSPLFVALQRLDDLAPIIRAGTKNDGVPFDAAADVRAMREERFSDA